ncbi:AraC family transcriptional regulator [Streptomyces sp. NPDC003635]
MNSTPQDRTIGFLRVSTTGGAAGTVAHEPDAGHLVIGLHTVGRATLIRDGNPEPCRPGDLFVCAGPFVLHESEPYTLHLVRLPRRTLALTDRQEQALTARAPSAEGPVAPLLGGVLRELTDVRGERAGLHLAGSVAELTVLLATEDGGPWETGLRDSGQAYGGLGDAGRQGGAPTRGGRRDGVPTHGGRQDGASAHGGQQREDLVRRVRAHVDAHLWDRRLTPASVAAAQHISVRYLHRLFEGQGSTIGRWIQHRRLEEARRELARPGRADLTVSAVARRWGFASATHFSRSFRAAYGMSPSDWRDGRIHPSS